MTRKVDAKGRSKYDHHVRLYDWLTGSAAWHSASGNAIKLLIYIATFDRGDNNGDIFMSERHAAAGIGVDRKTARKLFRELQELGFVRCTAEGSFKAKRSPAAKWRLTFKPWPSRSMGPSNEWRQWNPGADSRGEKLPADGGDIPPAAKKERSDGGETPPMQGSDPQKSASQEWGNTGPQLIAIGGCDSPVELIRGQVSDWWRVAQSKDRVRLAKQHGIEIGELLNFIGGGDLPFPKLVAIRSSLKVAA